MILTPTGCCFQLPLPLVSVSSCALLRQRPRLRRRLLQVYSLALSAGDSEKEYSLMVQLR